MQEQIVIVIPTFNEAANLVDVIGDVRASLPDADILVVDDNSPDGTGQIADQIAIADAHVQVLHRAHKEGLGAAYLDGFRTVLAAGYDVIGQMDADRSHPARFLPAMSAALESADLVIGSRYVAGGRVVNWPWHRRALSVGGNLYARRLLGIPVRDVTAGFRLYRRTTLEKIELDTVQSLGYVFQIDMALRTLHAGLRVVEVPIEFVERVRGDSKMTPKLARDSLRRVTRWGIQERLRRRRGRHPR